MAKQEVILNKNILSEALKRFELEKKIYSPELAGILKIPEEQCYIKIRGASLEDHIRARDLSSTPIRLLTEFLTELENKEEIDINKFKERHLNPKLSEKTTLILTIFHRCVIEPKFNYEEVLELSKKVPQFVDKIADEALNITSLGEQDDGN